MLCRERFLFLLRYGFAYVNRTIELEDGSKITTLEKHVMRYQQLFASLAIRKKLSKGVKSGIIWHTQGSGKTALAYYSVPFYEKSGIAAARHIIEVACGLHSQVLHEEQIVTQVQQAVGQARQLQTTDAILDTLFRTAVSAGKYALTHIVG